MVRGVLAIYRSGPLRSVLLALLLPSLIIVLWEAIVRAGLVAPQLIAPPSEVVIRLGEMLLSGDLLMHGYVSMRRLLLGFGIGACAGLVLGCGIGLSRQIENVLAPTLRFLSPVPPIAWIPLLIIAFGIGEASKVMLIVIAVTFIVMFNVVEGIRGADDSLVDVGRVYEKNWHQITRSILLPAAMPAIFSGLRVAMALSWILLIAAEVIASSRGLGWLIWDSRNFSRPDDMLVGVIAVGALGKATDSILARVQSRVLEWRQPYTGRR